MNVIDMIERVKNRALPGAYPTLVNEEESLKAIRAWLSLPNRDKSILSDETIALALLNLIDDINIEHHWDMMQSIMGENF